MGANEALTFLDSLQRHGLLSRRTVRQYVMPALYGSRDTKVGTDGYAELEGPLFREVVQEIQGRRLHADADPSEDAVSNEGAMYLRGLLEIATGDRRHRMICMGMRYDGFSKRAYEEVKEILGRTGMDYLGIKGRNESLEPSRAMIMDIVQEDESDGYADIPVGSGPLHGPFPQDEDPWETIRQEMEQYAELEEMENLLDIDMDAVPGDPGDSDEITYQSVYGMDLSEE
ncbi:MAG: hypothetical protein JXC85_00730 [Candidatus Aenigmarchaeota archaeon]|nr:hypothetical protein [Candidatus Aenigmarchaeota archaeon]